MNILDPMDKEARQARSHIQKGTDKLITAACASVIKEYWKDRGYLFKARIMMVSLAKKSDRATYTIKSNIGPYGTPPRARS